MWVKGCTLQMFVHLECFSLLYIQNETPCRIFKAIFFLLRACWPYCPSASTRWTCTIVLPTLRRRLVKRPERHGRTFLTSSMNCWVGDHEISMSAASCHLVLSHCATTRVIWIYLFSFIACTVINPASAWLQGKTLKNICLPPSGSVFAFH